MDPRISNPSRLQRSSSHTLRNVQAGEGGQEHSAEARPRGSQRDAMRPGYLLLPPEARQGREIRVIKIRQRIFKVEAKRAVFPIVSNQGTGGCNLQIREVNKEHKINFTAKRSTVCLKK